MGGWGHRQVSSLRSSFSAGSKSPVGSKEADWWSVFLLEPPIFLPSLRECCSSIQKSSFWGAVMLVCLNWILWSNILSLAREEFYYFYLNLRIMRGQVNFILKVMLLPQNHEEACGLAGRSGLMTTTDWRRATEEIMTTLVPPFKVRKYLFRE